MGTTTTLLGLYKPDVGEIGWGLLRNASYDDLDTSLGTQHGLNGVHRIVTVNDGTGYIKFPELTTIQRDALPAFVGTTVYNTDDAELQSFQAGTWQTVITSSLTVQESDLAPSINPCTTIQFPNATVTDLGSGVASIDGFVTHNEGQVVGDMLYFDGVFWSRFAPGLLGQHLITNGAGNAPTWANTTAGGNVVSGSNLTDNAIVRGDGGATNIQTSGIIIDDSDNVTGIVNITTTGTVTFNGVTYTFPGADASGVLTSDGAGNLSWAAAGGGTFLSLSDTPGSYAGASLQSVRVNVGESALEFFTPSAGGSAETVTRDINQTTHGFAVGEWLRHNGTIYVLAQADVDANSDALGVVSAVAGVDDFTLFVHGYITGLSGLTAGAAHFISDTVAGAITATPPADLGEIVKPVIVTDSTTTGYVNVMRGNEITATAGITVDDEGTPITTNVESIDFVGAGVVATNSGNDVTVTIAGGGGATLDHDVNQTTHGFSVNDWVYNTGGATSYALADASAASTAESIGIVSDVADVNNFTVQFGGRITGLTGLTAGEAHFLSEVAGDITATAPSTVGAVIKPVLVADSTTSGFIFNMRGSEIVGEAASSFLLAFGDVTLSSGILTVTHSLGVQYVTVEVYDDSDLVVQPDDITATSTTVTTIDFSSFGTLGGGATDWHVRVVG